MVAQIRGMEMRLSFPQYKMAQVIVEELLLTANWNLHFSIEGVPGLSEKRLAGKRGKLITSR